VLLRLGRHDIGQAQIGRIVHSTRPCNPNLALKDKRNERLGDKSAAGYVRPGMGRPAKMRSRQAAALERSASAEARIAEIRSA